MRSWTRRGIIGAGLALAGCTALRRPPLVDAYGDIVRPPGQPPLILIPGAFGSTLRERATGRELWPASNSQLLLGEYRSLELPFDPDTLEPVANGTEAYAVFREGLGRDFYGSIIDVLERVGGYERHRAGDPPGAGPPRGLYLYPYDFRLDNVHSARGLQALIEHIRLDYGDPQLRVDVIAHSNGGLVARYFVRYGTRAVSAGEAVEPDFAGAGSIRRLLLVGTPNLGTLQPVLSLLRGEEIGLRNIPAEIVATMPGLTQIMPHPGVPWLVDPQGNHIDADLYDIATWRDFQWSLFDPDIAERTVASHGGHGHGRRYLERLRAYLGRLLEDGRAFAETFATQPDPRDVPTWVFGADCEPTLARLLVESAGGRLRARERVADVTTPACRDYATLMFDPGDTVVTRASLLGQHARETTRPRAPDESLRIAHSLLLCERHQQLPGSPDLLENLLQALFSVDLG